MCSLNLIYVKVKAIVLTKGRNTINMQAALAAVPGALRAGSDSSQRGTWGEAALENTARRKM